jgi:uncharacterized protein YodC (DUF2158 family)
MGSEVRMAERLSFEAGDVVRLKSGGPRMTIMTIGEKTATCVWFGTNVCGQWTDLTAQGFDITSLDFAEDGE